MEHILTDELIAAVMAALERKHPAPSGLSGETPVFHLGVHGELSPMDFKRCLASLIRNDLLKKKGSVNNVNLLQNCVMVPS